MYHTKNFNSKTHIFITICIFFTLQLLSQSKKDSLLDIIKNSDNLLNKNRAYLELGKLYSLKGEYDKSISILKKEIQNENKLISINTKLAYYQEISMSYLNKRQLDSAKSYINKAEVIYENHEDKNKINNAPYNLKSMIFRKSGNYTEAIKFSFKSINLHKQNKEYAKISTGYNSLGIIYEKIKEYKKAENCYLEAIFFLEKEKKNSKFNKSIIDNIDANILMNLGIVLKEQKLFKLALNYYRKSKKIFKSLGNKHRQAFILNNIGRIYLLQKDYNSSIDIFNQVLKLKSKYGNLKDQLSTLNNLSEAYRKKGYFEKSLSLAYRANLIMHQNKNLSLNIQKNTLFNLSQAEEVSGNILNAFSYYKKFNQLSDSLINKNKIREIAQLETKFNLKEKENKILKLSNENIKKGAETEVKKNQLNYALFGGGTILLLSLFTLQAYRKEKKSKEQVVNQKREIETLHKELHHRVKNNLGIAKSFAKVAKRNISDSKGKEVLDALQSRIVSMANIHELLYQQENVSVINFQAYTERICNEISKTYNTLKENITYNIDASIKIPIVEATPLGLILNEAITNSYKHAFKQQSDGVITIVLKENNDYVFCTISDNGIGIPSKESQTTKKSYGMELIHSLVMQLSGTIDIATNNGTHIQITIPKNQNES